MSYPRGQHPNSRKNLKSIDETVRGTHEGFMQKAKPFQVKFDEVDLQTLKIEAKEQGLPLSKYVRILLNEARLNRGYNSLKSVDKSMN